MSDFQKIPYYDLKNELAAKRLPICIGRNEEVHRILRVLTRTLAHHAVIIGPSGIGKTALLFGLARTAAVQNTNFSTANIVLLHTPSLQKAGILAASLISGYQEAFAHIKNSIIIIDDFGSLTSAQPGAAHNWLIILEPLFEKNDIRLVLSMNPEHYQWMQKNAAGFCGNFEAFQLEEQPEAEERAIIQGVFNKTTHGSPAVVSRENIALATGLVRRFPKLGQLPKAAIQLLDECIAETKTMNLRAADNPHPVLRHLRIKVFPAITADVVLKIVSEKANVPLQTLTTNERQHLKALPEILERQIIGQRPAIGAISSAVQRAKLGLRSASRPLASFLLLGPSGVGKTETAKLLSATLYGKPASLLRIDMSEFGEAHTVQRLIGSPPGYVGSDSGGQLTNHLKDEPYSMILLDEVEKAHPKIFDIFLQLLDDGRLTSGQGETVDATQSIVMATSNLAVDAIIAAHGAGNDIHNPLFLKQQLMPILAKNFRMEFLNRFDAIVVYNPLSVGDLTDIALLEIKKIEQRTAAHNITFRIDRLTLEKKIRELADPRFGARPVKRFVEDMCEGLITKTLLQ